MNVIKTSGFSRRRNRNFKSAVFLHFRAATHNACNQIRRPPAARNNLGCPRFIPVLLLLENEKVTKPTMIGQTTVKESGRIGGVWFFLSY